jgi:hypothetical protein
MTPKRLPYCRAGCPPPSTPDGAMLLGHLSQTHPQEVKPYLERMRTEDIGTVAAEAYQVVDEEDDGI